jgi:anti-sigma B factor antagonist
VVERTGSSFQLMRVGPDGRFKLTGEVDMGVAGGLFVLLQQSMDGTRDLSLDLSDLEFIDSSGIRALIQVAQLLHGRGRLILESPRGAVARVLEIVGADRWPDVEVRQSRKSPDRIT